MEKINKRLLLAGFSSLLLFACGGDDSSNKVDNGQPNTPEVEVPTAVDDQYSLVASNDELTFDVLENDINPLTNAISLINASASVGEVRIDSNKLVYRLTENQYAETVAITYTINGGSSAQVNLKLLPSAENAARFLVQSSFGSTQASIKSVQNIGIEGWLEEQFAMPEPKHSEGMWPLTGKQPITHYSRLRQLTHYWYEQGKLPQDVSDASATYNESGNFQIDDWQLRTWWDISLGAPDQLRQRMAFALSELLVVSNNESPLHRRGEALAVYYDLLVKHAFGQYRELLNDVSQSVAMGIFLSHQGNRKADQVAGTTADENYARELLQLFSIGLYQLNEDGSAKKDANGDLLPAYTQTDVENLARVFTGWTRQQATKFGRLNSKGGGYNLPMQCDMEFHDSGAKEVLGTSIAAGQTCEQDLQSVLTILMAHPNTAVFVSKHFISRFVTSNPSPAYVKRVVTVFKQTEGNLKALIKAILLDDEARLVGTGQLASRIKSPIQITAQLFRALAPITQQPYIDNAHYIPGRIEAVIQPTRAYTVFNFYSSDFGFVDESSGDIINAPEAELLTDARMADHNNHLIDLLHFKEAQHQMAKAVTEGKDWQAFEKTRNYLYITRYLDVEAQMLMAQEILGEDYAGIKDAELKTQFIKLLLPELNLLLLENRFSEQHLQLIEQHLQQHYLPGSERRKTARLISEALRYLVTSSVFSIQE